MQTSANAVMCGYVLRSHAMERNIWTRVSNVTAFESHALSEPERRVVPDDVNGAFGSWALS